MQWCVEHEGHGSSLVQDSSKENPVLTVSAVFFLQWLGDVAPETSHAALCRAAGIQPSTLAQQLVRGPVSLATVVAISRSRQLPVVESLSAFPSYSDLAEGAAEPTDAELLSQISDMDLLREILSRSAHAQSGTQVYGTKLSPIPHRSSVRTWVDAIRSSRPAATALLGCRDCTAKSLCPNQRRPAQP